MEGFLIAVVKKGMDRNKALKIHSILWEVNKEEIVGTASFCGINRSRTMRVRSSLNKG
jgi:hypothetical protein